MMTRRREEDAEGRRRRLLEDIAEYLRGEFPDLDIEPPQLPDRRIRALRGSQLVHDVYFRWEFHEDPIAFLKRWGLPRVCETTERRPCGSARQGCHDRR